MVGRRRYSFKSVAFCGCVCATPASSLLAEGQQQVAREGVGVTAACVVQCQPLLLHFSVHTACGPWVLSMAMLRNAAASYMCGY